MASLIKINRIHRRFKKIGRILYEPYRNPMVGISTGFNNRISLEFIRIRPSGPLVIPSPGFPSGSVGWSDLSRSDQIRYRIDSHGKRLLPSCLTLNAKIKSGLFELTVRTDCQMIRSFYFALRLRLKPFKLKNG
jgi:hypothetical protein